MVPYRGRFALRITRLILSIACAGWYFRLGGLGWNVVTGLLGVYIAFAIFALSRRDLDSVARARAALVIDAGYYALWAWTAPASWQAVMACGYLLVTVSLLHELALAGVTSCGIILLALIFAPMGPLVAAAFSMSGVTVGCAVYRWYLERRMSITLRHNVVIRSQAQGAREAERQRIAADFHDGPLQSFVGFQMRLEIIRKQMERSPQAALEELRGLQELCKNQVADLRSFVRSMRPADEGMSLAASLARMTESLQRDTGISATFTGEDLQDSQEVEKSLEILQIVREAFHNIQKHSHASQVALSARRRGRNVEVVVEDKGSGFPFAGLFTLDELDALRAGPVSIKRRVRMLGGNLKIDSRPEEGAKITFQVPF